MKKTQTLHNAAGKGNIEVLKYLLARGADMNYHTEYNYIPLELAVLHRQLESVRFLVENVPDLIWGTGCHYAASLGEQEILSLLLSHGAPVDGIDEYERTAAHWAAQEGKMKALRILHAYHANWNILDDVGDSVLCIAAGEGNLEMVNYLLETGAEVDFGEEVTPLMTTCLWCYYDIATRLLQAGANVNFADQEGRTVLFYATVRGDKELQEFLYSNGADPSIVDNEGISVLDLSDPKILKELHKDLYE